MSLLTSKEHYCRHVRTNRLSHTASVRFSGAGYGVKMVGLNQTNYYDSLYDRSGQGSLHYLLVMKCIAICLSMR